MTKNNLIIVIYSHFTWLNNHFLEWMKKKRSPILFSYWDKDCQFYSFESERRKIFFFSLSSLSLFSPLTSTYLSLCSLSRLQSTTGTVITFFSFKFNRIHTHTHTHIYQPTFVSSIVLLILSFNVGQWDWITPYYSRWHHHLYVHRIKKHKNDFWNGVKMSLGIMK